MSKNCFGCNRENAEDQTYCGTCGSPLALTSYIARQVDSRLAETTRDRELVERESAIRIFEKAYGWAKLVAAVCAAVLAILAVGATWRFLDLRSAVNSAEQSVSISRDAAEKTIGDTAAKTRSDLTKESTASLQAIRTAEQEATQSSARSQSVAKAQGTAISHQALAVRKEFQEQAAAVSKDVSTARQQIQAASQLQPQMQTMQQQLSSAQAQIQQQQKVITSSADFAKQIFSSHRQLVFDLKTSNKSAYAITEPDPGKQSQAVYLLLPETPVNGTVQLQFNQIVAAPNSFTVFHNLLVVYIQPSARQELLSKQVSVAYFPDPADSVRIGSLSLQQNRVFADGEALPRFGQKDPDFPGSKWAPANYQNFEVKEP